MNANTRHDASLSTAREHVTSPSPVAAPAPEPKKRTSTDATKAASAVNKLSKLDADEARELAETPDAIARRYREKREAVVAELSEGVRDLVERMRGS